jgi:hypothetical protein
MLALLWVFPTLGAVWIWVMEGERLRAGPTWGAKLARISLEQWIALALVMLHVTFVILAIHHRKAAKSARGG